MQYVWNGQTIRWFMEASAYTGFHKTLAGKIIPYLNKGDTLCDLGCGVGRLDLELAPYVSHLTAIDLNENAVSILRQDAELSGLRNLSADCADAGTLDGNFDILLTSFFGRPEMADLLRLCRRRLIRIVHMEIKGRLYPGRPRFTQKDTVDMVQQELAAMGVAYRLETDSIEFGQPFRSWQDAVLFVRNNASDACDGEIDGFLQDNIIRTGRDDFPFYLPNPKEFGIFVIDREV